MHGHIIDRHLLQCFTLLPPSLLPAARRALRSTLLGVLVPLGVVVGAWLLLLASCLLLPACPLRRAWSSKTTPTREDHDTPLAAAPSE